MKVKQTEQVKETAAIGYRTDTGRSAGKGLSGARTFLEREAALEAIFLTTAFETGV